MKFAIQLINGGYKTVQSTDTLENFCKKVQDAGGITLHEQVAIIGQRENKEEKTWIPYHAMAWIREQ